MSRSWTGKISVEVEGVQLQAEHLTESLAESVLRTAARLRSIDRRHMDLQKRDVLNP